MMSVLKKTPTFFKLFPIPEFLLLSNSGVAVSDDAVRFVQFRKGIKGDELDLVHATEHGLKEGTVDDGHVVDRNTLGVTLKQLKEKYHVDYTRVTLPEEKAYLFTAIIEKVPLDNLHDAVAFIVEENVPVSLKESLFDIEIIPIDSDEEMKVAVSVLPKSVVANYTSVFEDVGITPISFDIESQAISRAVVPRGDSRAHLIANISEDKTGLYITEDEIVQFTSTSTYGSRGGDDVYPDLPDLRAEIKKLIAFWNSKKDPKGKERKIEKIIVCGSGAANRNFIQALFGEMEVEWVLADVWTNAFSVKKKLPSMSYEESLGYAAAVGLSLPFKERIYV